MAFHIATCAIGIVVGQEHCIRTWGIAVVVIPCKTYRFVTLKAIIWLTFAADAGNVTEIADPIGGVAIVSDRAVFQAG